MNNKIDFIKIFFTEEKIESLIFIFLGIIAICLAFIFLFVIKYSFYKGIAYPLLIIGIIQLTFGSLSFLKSDSDMKRKEFYNKNQTEYIIQNELPRMEIVIKNLIIYKWIEISLMLLGVFLYFCFRYSTQKFWKGLGLGLLIQALIMLSLDFVAERRSVTYLNKIKMVSVFIVARN